MTAQTNYCPICGRPIADTAYICHGCVTHLGKMLERAEGWWDDSEDTLIRRDVVTRLGGAERLREGDESPIPHERPLPWSEAAAEARFVAQNTATNWARHIAETRGLDLPQTA